MIQHLDNAEDHRKGAKNKIKIEKNSALFEIIGDEEIISCCNHHQLVKRLGNDIKIMLDLLTIEHKNIIRSHDPTDVKSCYAF